MAPASSLLAIDNAAKAQRAVREKLQEFEHSQARTKDKRTQRIRTKRIWAKKAADERRWIMAQVEQPASSSGEYIERSECVDTESKFSKLIYYQLTP